jgi:cell division protein FtsA
MKNEFVTVLDLGSSKATCLMASGGESGDLKVHGLATVESRGVKRGVVVDLEETSRAIDAVVRRVQQEADRDAGLLIVGVSGSHVEGQNAQGFVPIYPRSRHVTREDVHQVINHSRQLMIPPDREQLQAIPREFRIDGQRNIQRPVGMSGSRLEVVTFIVTGQSTHIQNLERSVEMAGRKVEQMMLQPLASGLGVLSQEELENGAAVVDIGAGKTDVAVFVGGSIAYTACLPIGSAHVTSDLSKLLKTSPEEAERLKIQYGAAMANSVSDKESVEVMQLGQIQARPMQRRVLCEIIESRMRELAVLVRQQVEKSGMVGMLPGGVAITGGGAAMPATDKLLESVLKHVRVRHAEPELGGERRPGMAAAVGMARFAIQCAGDELSPASGNLSWKDRIRMIRSVLGK